MIVPSAIIVLIITQAILLITPIIVQTALNQYWAIEVAHNRLENTPLRHGGVIVSIMIVITIISFLWFEQNASYSVTIFDYGSIDDYRFIREYGNVWSLRKDATRFSREKYDIDEYPYFIVKERGSSEVVFRTNDIEELLEFLDR